MGDIKAGEPFGIDAAVLANIDWELALKRISHDLRSDFIYAPHLGFIYSKAGEELIGQVNGDFESRTIQSGILRLRFQSHFEFALPFRPNGLAQPIHAREAS